MSCFVQPTVAQICSVYNRIKRRNAADPHFGEPDTWDTLAFLLEEILYDKWFSKIFAFYFSVGQIIV